MTASAYVFWASVVLDSVFEDDTPWVLFINARPPVGVYPLAVDGPIRVSGALAHADVLDGADAILRGHHWMHATPWEISVRGWTCWLQPDDLAQLTLPAESERLSTV